MNKPAVIGFTGLAVIAVATFVAARSTSHGPAAELAQASATAGDLVTEAQAGEARAAAEERVAIVIFEPRRGASPRIIHVPQAPERSRASANDSAAAPAVDEDDEVAPPPPPSRYRVIPLPRRAAAPRDDSVPPLGKPRTAVTLPPPAPDESATDILTPIHPTPRYNSGGAPVTPNEALTTETLPPPPPSGYAPPSGLRDRNSPQK